MNNSPMLEPYIEKDYDINFKLSIFESFLLILIAELLMNFLAIALGYSIDFLLYKNLIDYIGILIAFIYGFYLLGGSFREENISFSKELALNQKNYETSFTELLKESKVEKQEEKLINQRYNLNEKLETISEVEASKEETKKFQIKKEGYNFPKVDNSNNTTNNEIKRDDTELEISLNEILEKKDEESHELDLESFWTIFKTMIISEFFDRSQISTLSMSSIFNFSGVLIGSSIALTITCYLGAYQGKRIIKILKEKIISFILGCIFIIYGIQVYIGKKKYDNQITAGL